MVSSICIFYYSFVCIHSNVYTYVVSSITYVVPSIRLPTFFVHAFKIVVGSRKFSMLLLYILWDDWPIFMISGSNQQLQQELEYILLKTDSHSWWISKMQSDTFEERYAIKLCFKLGNNATETYEMLQTAFRPYCMNRASVFEWHKRFKEGSESVRDDERCGRSKEVNRPEMIGQTVKVRIRSTRVRIPVALLRSLSGKYPWERYKPSYPPSYGLNSTTTVLLGEWLWH